ncbi:alanine racemase [Gluconobacter roseus]|uniref:Alanine racemase n=1 Tax=Gluconobacter roseus NBRC 3990 TaxID=1307950 RepID=A0A4Y3M493_9PROT|nr:alanine racemase [Gluconobacter roseus]KXV43762.1 alanine racemase [Gluconobacter roseus]GBR46040.1 alanine racemase [Gluconobacter roseus NBRC 3990]GEB03187.1 alanine racemase, catabolic [Gluconobacter roseus NBRC 3990]GLP93645.1 alanine racemase, catabolic [Gluconobacter roseus NBRC 3990]
MQTLFQDAASARAGAWMTVSLRAITENYGFVAGLAPEAECAAVVKADAYGLGADRIAPVLAAQNAKTFFVAHLDEGIALRAVLPDVRIFVLHGFMPGCEGSMQSHDLIPVLNDLDQVRSWKRFCNGKGYAFPAALQFDSGMSRFGLNSADLDDHTLFDGLNLQLVMSHLACADEPDNLSNDTQRQRFVDMAACFPGVPRSLSASSGIFLGPEYHFELIRPGAALYGIAPSEGNRMLRPVVSLDARIVQIRTVEAGDRVGYGLSWTAMKPTRVATLGLGYADGFFRAQEGRGAVWHDRTRLPVIGRVSMDSISVDLTEAPADLEAGDVLSALGPAQDVDALARSAGTIGYEVLTSLGNRFHRVYVPP